MEINLKFEYKNLTYEDLEILLQDLQESALLRGGMVYSITKVKSSQKIDNTPPVEQAIKELHKCLGKSGESK